MRMEDLTKDIPKPLLQIGGKPTLCRLMDHYAKYGIEEFILCVGYLGDKIEDYFKQNPVKYNVKVVDTGNNCTKEERLLKVRDLLGEQFYVAYGDDLSDVDLNKLKQFYIKMGKTAVLTAIRPQNPFGVLDIDNETGLIKNFKEKPLMNEWINGGYFIFNKNIFDYFDKGDELEKEIFEKLVKKGEIAAYQHTGFWKSMNTTKDYAELNLMYEQGKL